MIDDLIKPVIEQELLMAWVKLELEFDPQSYDTVNTVGRLGYFLHLKWDKSSNNTFVKFFRVKWIYNLYNKVW